MNFMSSLLFYFSALYMSFSILIFIKAYPFLKKHQFNSFWVKTIVYRSLFWPNEVFHNGIGQFLAYYFANLEPHEYQELKFNRSKESKLFKNATYLIYKAPDDKDTFFILAHSKQMSFYSLLEIKSNNGSIFGKENLSYSFFLLKNIVKRFASLEDLLQHVYKKTIITPEIIANIKNQLISPDHKTGKIIRLN